MLWNYKELKKEYKEDLLNMLCFLKIVSGLGHKNSALLPPLPASCVRIFPCLISEAVVREYSLC